MKKQKVKKANRNRGKKFIATAAVAVTATGLSLVNVTPVFADSRPNVIDRTAEILGVPSDDLLNALKQAQVENVEYQIFSGQIDSETGIRLIHSIDEYSNEDFVLTTQEKNALGDNKNEVLNYLNISNEEFDLLMQTGYNLTEIAEMKGIEKYELKDKVQEFQIDSINKNTELNSYEKEELVKKLDVISESIIEYRL